MMSGASQKKIVPVPYNKPERFVVIIGAMKSGTTSLFDILGQHPQICAAKKKEPNFFVADSGSKNVDGYLGLWAWDRARYKYALESSVAYTKLPFVKGVPERMARMGLGKYRFIYLMREPFARIESQVRHGLFSGWGKSLDEGIGNDLVDFSRYAMQMDEYLKFFPKESICPVVLEEFKSRPRHVLERICDFLEIDRHYVFSNVEEPRNSGEFFESSPVIRRLTQSRLWKQVVRKLLPFRLKNWLRKKIAGAGNRGEEKQAIGRWRLTDDEKNEITRKLMPDLTRLQTEYAVDIHKYWAIPNDVLD